MEGYKGQDNQRPRFNIYEVGAVHVIVIWLWEVWRDDVTSGAIEPASTSYTRIKIHHQVIHYHLQQLLRREKDVSLPFHEVSTENFLRYS